MAALYRDAATQAARMLRSHGIMNAELFVKLVEEMTDLKLQHQAETHLKHNPEVARLLQAKRETDRHRLEQIRVEMVRCLKT